MPAPRTILGAERPLVLGSASPRRKDILESLGIPLRVVPGDVDETRRAGESATVYLERVVREKLEDVARRLDGTDAPAILVADTTVVLGDDVLGKPSGVDEAEALVSRLVGRTHVVRTRYAISGEPELRAPKLARTVETHVTMRPADAASVRAYAETGEGLDKAGAYAAQGIGSYLVLRIDGSYTNVVGLPASEVVLDLVALGLIPSFPLPRS